MRYDLKKIKLGNSLFGLFGDEEDIFSPKSVMLIREISTKKTIDSQENYFDENLLKSFFSTIKINKKVLLFRSLLKVKDAFSSSISQCSWWIASSLKKRNIPFVFSDVKLTLDGNDFTGYDNLRQILFKEKDIGFVVLPLLEFYINGARKICRYIKQYSNNIIIAAGSIMPTRHPYHVLAHFPEIGMVIRGDGDNAFADAVQILSTGNIEKLSALKGFFLRHKNIFLSSFTEKINKVENLDSLSLDFTLLSKKDVEHGGFFYLTRGCRNSCNFCVSYNRGNPRLVSSEKASLLFKEYCARVRDLYLGEVPKKALQIGFYDDDFFADKQTGIDILKAANREGIKISFVQTSIKSFFKDGNIDESFIKSINNDFFSESCKTVDMHPNIYLGTENFSEEELMVLGKPYGVREIIQVVHYLSLQGITQRHYVLLSNVFTKVHNIKENIAMVYHLRRKYPDYFLLLQNLTPSLYSFYGTSSYLRAKKAGLLQNTNPKMLTIKGFPEFDYPVAGGDTPADKEAAAIIPAAIEALQRI